MEFPVFPSGDRLRFLFMPKFDEKIKKSLLVGIPVICKVNLEQLISMDIVVLKHISEKGRHAKVNHMSWFVITSSRLPHYQVSHITKIVLNFKLKIFK